MIVTLFLLTIGAYLTCGFLLPVRSLSVKVAQGFVMNTIQFTTMLAACWLLVASSASAAEPAAPEKTGLAVGARAPAFTLKDQNDRDVSLGALLKKGPVALVFYRSADW